MRESEKRLFQIAIEQAVKIAIVAVMIGAVIYFTPPDTMQKIQNRWERFKQEFKERHQPFYEFLVGKDMERVKGQYGQFK